MNANLANYIRRYIEISDQELDTFHSFLEPVEVKKKHFLLKEGQICKSRYFITSGCIRLFYIDSKGNEQIIHFGIDNWWITDYESLINDAPTKLYIQAVENTSLLALPNDKFEALCSELPQTERLFRKIMEKSFIAMQNRIAYIFSMKGEEQLDIFMSANPDFVQRVPQYMIASYLGMSPEFVSKIRGKRK